MKKYDKFFVWTIGLVILLNSLFFRYSQDGNAINVALYLIVYLVILKLWTSSED